MEYGMSLLWACLATFVSLTQQTTHSTAVAGVTVDPPANITIVDPGHLGHLTIEWTRPKSLQNLTDCTVRYQLKFYDAYAGRWKSVRTLGLSYSAQFDLEKPVEIRMLTLVKGACTNGKEVLGTEVELVHIPEHTGVAGSRVKKFHCVYFNKEYMDCTWEPGVAEPSDSKHYLYYWHREMQETQECPEYIPSSQLRRGCRFPRESLLEFSEFNICVNGSSAQGPMMPAFFSIEVQNHVQPAIVTNLELSFQEGLVQVQWAPPAGLVPEQCLEYELETTVESMDGSEWQQMNVTEDTIIDFLREDETKRNCFRVRSKVNTYCADEGFWSDWSQSECIPETNAVSTHPVPLWNNLALVGMLAIVPAVILVFGFTLWMFRKMWANRMEKEEVLCTLYREKMHKAFPPFFSQVLS